jgi:methylenetetrahydrofolate dehydrogenase (NADP+) / methenyltetrahydrofolate cyclohydrolase
VANIIDGKKIAEEILADVKKQAESLSRKGIKPGLATVLVGEDPASHVYVGQKIKKCEANGLASIHRPLPASVSQKELENVVRELNADKSVHGMIIQLPLPKTLDSERVVHLVDPRKDADGLHPFNQGLVGRLKTWRDIILSGIPIPCTPAGVIELLLRSKVKVSGSHAVVIGRSTLVGKPVAQLLLSLDATVTVAHSRTQDLAATCRSADILIAALGKPGFVGKDYVKKGAVVIDVGISRTEKGVQGDVDFDAVKDLASQITPVPGGVGPMTVAMLLLNTVRAAERRGQTP